MLPAKFKKLNRYEQPYVSNIVVLLFSVFFCIFSASNKVQYIYAVSCIVAGLVYFMVCYDAYKLCKKHSDLMEAYRKKHPGKMDPIILTPENIEEE